jgi:hypothetical protein
MKIINCRDESLSREWIVISRSRISLIMWNPDLHHYVHKILSVSNVVKLLKPGHALTPRSTQIPFFRIRGSIIWEAMRTVSKSLCKFLITVHVLFCGGNTKQYG